MSDKLRKKMQDELLAIAKESNVSHQEFLSDLGSTFLNISGAVCEVLGFTDEERNEFFNMLIEGLQTSIYEVEKRRAKNGTV